MFQRLNNKAKVQVHVAKLSEEFHQISRMEKFMDTEEAEDYEAGVIMEMPQSLGS